MHISQISLRDWKSLAVAQFRFPAPGSDANVVLVGTPNGFGKTSFFETAVIGIFGREGLPPIARPQFLGADNECQTTSYRVFLEKAMHRGTLEAGRNSCSTKVTFVDDSGEPIELQPIWRSSKSGSYRAQDEEVHIYCRTSRIAQGQKRKVGAERLEWFRGYVAENLMPFTLAHFS